ncbi:MULTISPECIES: hypothetical protein [unclassified Streptomyces]|uniref:hypothetical protein n=1 Tax=unclassified Streptomyces TaxID=2593676 RepID=UPI0035D6BE41
MHKVSHLSAFLENLNWSPERLAREINRRYGEGTVSLKAPYGWAKGAYPRGQVPRFVASILSEQLGRAIDISQIWPQRFPDARSGGAGPGLGAPWSEQQVDRILGLLLDQEEHGTGELTQSAEPVPGPVLVSLAVDWLTADTTLTTARSEGPELSAGMVDVLTDRIARLRRLGSAQNGALITQWVVHELRWARQVSGTAAYEAPIGRRLYGAIGELAQLAGWLAEGRGHYVEGQQYLLAALHASGLAGDRDLGVYVLSCLSYHLTKYGSGRDALRLVKLADIGMENARPGVQRSLEATREACARVASGEEPGSTDRDGAAVHRIGLAELIASALLRPDDEGPSPQPATPARRPVAVASGPTSPPSGYVGCCGEETRTGNNPGGTAGSPAA